MISIIVPARNGADMTRKCLATLLYSVAFLKLGCEFILIDDNSAPDEKILDVFKEHRAKAFGHACKIIRAKTHQHFSGVFSAGLNLSTGDIIYFISNDMMLTPEFLLGLLSVASLSNDIGTVRGTSNYTDSHPEHHVDPPAPPKSYKEIGSFATQQFQDNGLRYVEDKLLTGDAVLVKRALVDKIGVLDLRFFGYFGDVDYGMRAHLAGFKLVCAKGAWLFHHGQGHMQRDLEKQRGSAMQEHIARRMALVEKGYQQFRQKWSMALPTSFTKIGNLEFFETAQANAAKVELKYRTPPSFMDEFENL